MRITLILLPAALLFSPVDDRPLMHRKAASETVSRPLVELPLRGPRPETLLPQHSSAELTDLLTDIVSENIPHQYEDTKHWGKTKEVFRGLKLRREGLRIETKRRKKEVNHGNWRKYRISLVDPDDHLSVQIRNVHDAGEGKVGFEAVIACKLQAFARWSDWQWGVQVISLSADALADVELRMNCELGMQIDPSRLPPDVILRPKVIDADLVTRSFRVQRISKADGPVARELGRSLHRILTRKLDEKKEKMVGKINRQIAKREDRLRLSLHDIIAEKWSAFRGESEQQLLGASTQPPEATN